MWSSPLIFQFSPSWYLFSPPTQGDWWVWPALPRAHWRMIDSPHPAVSKGTSPPTPLPPQPRRRDRPPSPQGEGPTMSVKRPNPVDRIHHNIYFYLCVADICVCIFSVFSLFFPRKKLYWRTEEASETGFTNRQGHVLKHTQNCMMMDQFNAEKGGII